KSRSSDTSSGSGGTTFVSGSAASALISDLSPPCCSGTWRAGGGRTSFGCCARCWASCLLRWKGEFWLLVVLRHCSSFLRPRRNLRRNPRPVTHQLLVVDPATEVFLSRKRRFATAHTD